ncbi:MAG: RNA methyltransferase [Acidobacteria bacterium]|nr:RNA methyltransferase [Acidobacteriota bacterium]
MASVIDVPAWDDPRLAGYRAVSHPHAPEHEGLCIIEGRLVVPRMVALSREDGRWHAALQSVLVTPAAWALLAPELGDTSDLTVYRLAADHWQALTGFHLHRGCLALARRPAVPSLESIEPALARCIVVLERITNPDNIGGIFRSAAALGADLIVLGPGCGDPLYRKAIRTSMGATLEVPYVEAHTWPEALAWLRARGYCVVALTTPPADATLPEWSRPVQPLALLAGAEGDGLSADARRAADITVTIPMTGRVDSLNVATAVSIGLYHAEWTRQRDIAN